MIKVRSLLIGHPGLVFSKEERIGYTPLHLAAAIGHKDVAELLLARKAEVNAKDNDGWTPLHWAANKGHEDMAELLRHHGGHE